MPDNAKLPKKSKAKQRVNAGVSQASAKQKRLIFASEYISNGQNATQAAIVAGYSPKTAGSIGHALLKNLEIKAILGKANAEAARISGLSVERTLMEIARLAYSDPRNLYREDGTLKAIHELDDDTAATIASVEIDEIGSDGSVIGVTRKIKHWDKNAALEKAMKFHGLYAQDNVQRQSIVLNLNLTGIKQYLVD